MPPPIDPSRRAVLSGAVWAAVTFSTVALTPTAVAASLPPSESEGSLTSLNGWSVEDQAGDLLVVSECSVPGTGLTVPLRLGLAEAALVYLARRVHYEVEPLLPGDLSGWQPLESISLRSPLSNLSSGTAIRIRSQASTDAYFPLQELVVREILESADGVIRWGRDDSERDDSLFYIVARPSDEATRTVARGLRAADEIPGEGAGVIAEAPGTP